MANWCNTAYVIEGNAQEVKELYELMKRLEEREEPSVENGFGTAWLGCLVDALGGVCGEIRCNGDWSDLLFDGELLRFSTETTWSPCNEVFDFVCRKFPTLRYYFQSEVSGMEEYWTNDRESKYFTDKYIIEVYTPDKEYFHEHLTDLAALLKRFEEIANQPVRSLQDAHAVVERWQQESSNVFCNITEYMICD